MSTNQSEYGWNSTLRRKKPGKEALQKERKPMARKTPMKKVSKKQAQKNAIYSVTGPRFLAANPTCAFPGCYHPSEQVHHAKKRGIYMLDESTWVALCMEHHSWVEANKREAREMGLLAKPC